ncbi:2-succinyl-5-enolpyruvyl-6-hydroxy-3-cyclohexene-1-carboxylic-acid synthase [Demequina sp. TTPB684]|uniref:2-succinyl-5-enolpyruvyl-6-hydroxy-3- cyclohexene-1-carboxylic-acid synthase n=1 Tax=unclassified Demequina TaxID=2620311 RepID=UPI001CF476EB|nr:MULTISPECIES: 2-succinyl-5-enolpyruvyl-6-hydroxy-3-cyclohexene-1-carboxylic-acid synthase [unclassified Demequina]MCB2411475.1 2-succinyl-5-enolpyruvyl-6-hydroxy-3-cyclohexene-1-carboxylic-acid synthase [Demequina sp. TTPB684]UPU88304.1 2-succinyl-5-enolpyruvyl-6-hydroxy-3-cyclohexene-1-carboxylic-acid synthase [Demequina sp. TMPB413]
MTHPAAAFARELIAAFAAHGVTDYVLCPGSRSGPLAHALAEAASDTPPLGAPHVNLHVRIDERSAAFLALGISRGRSLTGPPRPVAIVTTSGTAVGNLMPAVMEAHHAGLPLLLLTADRPHELRGIGANQTTDQEGLFGTFVRWASTSSAPERLERGGRATLLAARAVHWATGNTERDDLAAAPGPVHLNLEFRDPLGPDAGSWPDVRQEKATLLDRTRTRLQTLSMSARKLPDGTRGVVIAGDGAGDDARRVAEARGWPLLAEPTSGARTGDNALVHYVELLASNAGQQLADRVHHVVVIGRPTLSRPVQRLIDIAPSLHVAAHGARWRETPRHAERVLPSVPDEWFAPAQVDDEWLAEWRRGCAAMATHADRWDARAAARVFVSSLKADDVAMLGSSGPIRMVDAVAPVWPVGHAPTLCANRGLAGIDGTVSTAMGIALALGRPASAFMGDLTFLHDVGGLLVGTEERVPDLRIVVVNDGGGTIFGRLEHAAAPAQNVRRVFTTPHAVDLAGFATAYGAVHTRVKSVGGLQRALAKPPTGVHIVEAVV